MTDDDPDIDDLAAEIAALRKAGRFEEAAQRSLAAGRNDEAAALFAEVWNWSRAAAVSEEAGSYAKAYAYALEGGDRYALARLMQILPEHPEQAIEASAAAEAKGRVVDAGRLREAAGDILEAAALFTRAGELFEAARLFESAGRYREAGMLYERRLAEDGTDGEAALRLGRILAHFGRYEHAVRALQRAEEDEERRVPALELSIACFDALGMHEAAGACLERLRREDPSAPARVADFLQATYGDEKGLAGLAKGGEATQLLAGRYRIVRSLGSGGSGRVLLAHDGFYDREVAVKILNVAAGARGRDAFSRFAQEARVAAGIEHPNVVRVHDFNPDGPFLVMEYMGGGTLEERLGAGAQLPLAVVKTVTLAVLRGLQAVHRRGVIHRDLKPANVFFGEAGDVKIGDFGVAHLQDLSATLTGALMGTLAYMAPEQITGSARPTAGTDLYAFGVIFHRMLTGTLPLPGPDFVTQHLRDVPPLLSSARPGLAPGFDELGAGLLAKEQAERPSSTEGVRAALELLDWTDPDDDELRELMAQAGRERRPVSVVPPPSDGAERYALVEARENGAFLAEDALISRTVRIEACDAERAVVLRAFAAADHPFLQAVFDIDEESGRAVLEEPHGEPLRRAALTDEARLVARGQVLEALKALHGQGIAHGSVSLSQIRVGGGRAVLMLPVHPSAHDPSEDFERLEELFS